jgi:hypothetical protein
LGKRKEKLKIGGKESFQAQCTWDYWSSLLSRSILPEAVLKRWKQGVTSTTKYRNCEGSVEIRLFATDMSGEVQDLAAFGDSGWVKNLHFTVTS